MMRHCIFFCDKSYMPIDMTFLIFYQFIKSNTDSKISILIIKIKNRVLRYCHYKAKNIIRPTTSTLNLQQPQNTYLQNSTAMISSLPSATFKKYELVVLYSREDCDGC